MSFDFLAVQFTDENQVDCVTQAMDVAPSGDDVILQTHYSCISAGTELAKLTGRQVIEFPIVLGNRAVTEVVAVGERVHRVKPGDLVLSYTAHAGMIKTQPQTIPATLPPELDTAEAALLGMAMVAMGGVRTAAPALGDVALVTGGGLVGQFAAQLMRASGATVVLSDPLSHRRRIAEACGVPHTAGPDELADVVADLTGGSGVNHILECTGVPAVVLQSIGLGRQGATMVLVGSPRGEYQADLTELLNSVHLAQPHGDITLKGALEWKYPVHASPFVEHSHEQNVKTLVQLVKSGTLQLQPLLSKVFSPRDAAEAYQSLQANPDEYMGVVFDWKKA